MAPPSYRVLELCSCGKAICDPPGYCTYCTLKSPPLTDEKRAAFWKKYQEECASKTRPPLDEPETQFAQDPGLPGNGHVSLKLGDVVKLYISKKTGKVWKPKDRWNGAGLVAGMVVYLGPSISIEEPSSYREDLSLWVDPRFAADFRELLVNSDGPFPRLRDSVERGPHHALVSVLVGGEGPQPPVYFHVPVTRLIFVREGNTGTCAGITPKS